MADRSQKTHYNVNAYCDNCDQAVEVRMPFGVPVKEPIQCPNCGCATAHRYGRWFCGTTDSGDPGRPYKKIAKDPTLF